MIRIVAEFRDSLKAVVPRIIALLLHNSDQVRVSAAFALKEFVTNGTNFSIPGLNDLPDICFEPIFVIPSTPQTYDIYSSTFFKIGL